MIDFERLQSNYLDDLNREYLYWKMIYEDCHADIALEMINHTIYCVNNFDQAYVNMIEQETRSFLNLILSRIRKYENPFCDQKNGYTRLGFSENDVLVAGFVNHAKYVKGYVSEEKVSNFISDVKKSLVIGYEKSISTEKRIEESQLRMQPVNEKQKVMKKEAK